METAIREAMEILERMPCGGVGADGPTLDELNEEAERGGNYANDAMYHSAQEAWRTLELALKGGSH